MCYNGYWGSVCRDYADKRAASVACKQLGYNDVVKGIYSHILINTDCCSVRRPHYGSTSEFLFKFCGLEASSKL